MNKPLPLIISFTIYLFFNFNLKAMDKKPYHHIYKRMASYLPLEI